MKINSFNEKFSKFSRVSAISDSARKSKKQIGITSKSGSKPNPEMERSESLGRNLLRKPSRNPKITSAVKLGFFLTIELESI
jgi:hypothetical protein